MALRVASRQEPPGASATGLAPGIGHPRHAVVYPLAADNVLRPLLTRLRGLQQPVIRVAHAFSRLQLALWACLCTHVMSTQRSTLCASTAPQAASRTRAGIELMHMLKQ